MKLDIDHVTKKYSSHTALHSLSVKLPDCQTIVMIGPSGGGKSTLLRLLGGLETPESGSIAFNGKPILFEENFLFNYRKNIGIVFQSWNLFPHLTALENIVLPLYRVHGFTKNDAETKSFELLRRFDLEKHAHKKPFALSGGQVQRVALIRAIAAQPKMLLLDEPTSALDPLMTAEVLELILELKKEGRNLILATHHLNFARRIADQILFIAEGKMLEYGAVDTVFNHPKSDLAKLYMKKVCSY